MNGEEFDMFLKRAVMAASGMLEKGAGYEEMLAFHYAIGLSLLGMQSGDGMPISQITKGGLDALHTTAHQLAHDTTFRLDSYSTEMIANLHIMCELGSAYESGLN